MRHIVTTTLLGATALSLLLIAGCPKEPTGPPEWADSRIDHGDTLENDPESRKPHLCVSGKYVYVVWHDDRGTGNNNVYLQVSQDGGQTWNPTDTLINSNDDGIFIAENPAIACDGESVFLVWEDDRDGDLRNKAIYFDASFNAGADWMGGNVNLTSDEDGDWNSMDPQIITRGSELIVLWSDGRDGAYDIYAQRSADAGATWLADERRVDTDDAGSAYSAKPRATAVTDGVGNLKTYVVWEDLRNASNDIFLNVSTDGGNSWSADQRIDLDGTSEPAESFGATVAAESDGLVAVVWHDERNGAYSDIYTAISSDGGVSFSEPLRLDVGSGPGVSDSLFPVVQVRDGAIYTAYRDDRHNAGFDILYTSSADQGATWTEEIALDTDDGSSHSIDPLMLMDGQGTIVVVWIDVGDGTEGVWEDILYNVSTDLGASWMSEEERVDDDERSSARSTEIDAALVDGTLYVVWEDYRFGTGDIFFRAIDL